MCVDHDEPSSPSSGRAPLRARLARAPRRRSRLRGLGWVRRWRLRRVSLRDRTPAEDNCCTAVPEASAAASRRLTALWRITSTVAKWETWTGLTFPEDGDYWFPAGSLPSRSIARQIGAATTNPMYGCTTGCDAAPFAGYGASWARVPHAVIHRTHYLDREPPESAPRSASPTTAQWSPQVGGRGSAQGTRNFHCCVDGLRRDFPGRWCDWDHTKSW